MPSSDIFDHFPHVQPRLEQQDILEGIVEARRDREHKFIIVQGPTGTGKTAIGGAVGSWTEDAYYLAEQKIHQQQAYEEFPSQIRVCKGKANYPCGEGDTPCYDNVPDMHCERKPGADRTGPFAFESASRGALNWAFEVDEYCPYMEAKAEAKQSPLACLNYSYFLRELYYDSDFGKRAVMICDEAHNIEGQVRNFLTIKITEETLDELGFSLKDRGTNIDDWHEWLIENFHSTLSARIKELNDRIARDWADDDLTGEVVARRDRLVELKGDIDLFQEEYWEEIEWAVDHDYENGDLVELSFAPVTVAPFTERLLFDHAETVVLMSASILDFDVFLRSVGLSQYKGEVTYFNADSPFPTENRPVYHYDGPRVSNDSWQRSFGKVSELVDVICRTKHPDDCGIVHTVSYRNGKELRQVVSPEVRDRMIHHHGELDREEQLRKFKASDNGIMLSPSMYEGVDLHDDLSRFQIVPKIPFLDLGSEFVKERRDLDPRWYAWRTAIRLIQSFGRSIRSADDWAHTYVLDGNFQWFYEQNGSMFPDYVTDAIKEGDIDALIEARV